MEMVRSIFCLRHLLLLKHQDKVHLTSSSWIMVQCVTSDKLSSTSLPPRPSIDITTLITGWIHSSSILRILLTPNYPYYYFFMFIILLFPVDHPTIKTIINILTFLHISYFIELQFVPSSSLSAPSHTHM